jgi:hypothetical protein
MHYDVVNLECLHISEKFGVDEPLQVEPTWGCADYMSATAKNIIDNFAESEKIKIDITIGI